MQSSQTAQKVIAACKSCDAVTLATATLFWPLRTYILASGFSSEYCHPLWHGKTRMAWLPDGEKISKIFLFVLTQLTNVTDRRTDRHCMTT